MMRKISAESLNCIGREKGFACSYVFNIGAGAGTTVMEMLAVFSSACGRDLPYQIVARRPGDIAAYFADATKARNILGWSAQHGLDDMCASSWKWQSQNRKGYRQ